jgi:hypothetical protein
MAQAVAWALVQQQYWVESCAVREPADASPVRSAARSSPTIEQDFLGRFGSGFRGGLVSSMRQGVDL